METISDKFATVRLRFGFMESPNVPKALVIARKLGWQFDIMATSFFVSRRSLKPSAQSGMPQWQDHLFIALSRSANDATDYFQIPTGRVVEVGTQVTIRIFMHICMARAQNQGRMRFKRRTISRPRFAICAVKHLRRPLPCPAMS